MPAHPRPRALVACRAVAATALLLSGCGGSAAASAPSSTASTSTTGTTSTANGVSALTAEQILAKALDAATGEKTVVVEGTAAGSTVRATLGTDASDTTITKGGQTTEVLRVGDATYIKGDVAFWTKALNASSAAVLAGKYVKVPAAQAQSYALFSSLKSFVGASLASNGTVTKAAESTRDGHAVVALTDSSDGSRLYVATEGDPLPVAIDKGGSDGGTVTFSHWGEPVTVNPPDAADVVDLSNVPRG